MGACSALGDGLAPLREALFTGLDGLRPVRRFSTDPFQASLAGMVPHYDDRAYDGGAMANRLCPAFASIAIREALAGIDPVPRTLLIMGTSQVDAELPVQIGRAHV